MDDADNQGANLKFHLNVNGPAACQELCSLDATCTHFSYYHRDYYLENWRQRCILKGNDDNIIDSPNVTSGPKFC